MLPCAFNFRHSNHLSLFYILPCPFPVEENFVTDLIWSSLSASLLTISRGSEWRKIKTASSKGYDVLQFNIQAIPETVLCNRKGVRHLVFKPESGINILLEFLDDWDHRSFGINAWHPCNTWQALDGWTGGSLASQGHLIYLSSFRDFAHSSNLTSQWLSEGIECTRWREPNCYV